MTALGARNVLLEKAPCWNSKRERSKWRKSKGTYPKGYYFYSPWSSPILKSKMVVTAMWLINKQLSPTQNTPALQASHTDFFFPLTFATGFFSLKLNSGWRDLHFHGNLLTRNFKRLANYARGSHNNSQCEYFNSVIYCLIHFGRYLLYRFNEQVCSQHFFKKSGNDKMSHYTR